MRLKLFFIIPEGMSSIKVKSINKEAYFLPVFLFTLLFIRCLLFFIDMNYCACRAGFHAFPATRAFILLFYQGVFVNYNVNFTENIFLHTSRHVQHAVQIRESKMINSVLLIRLFCFIA